MSQNRIYIVEDDKRLANDLRTVLARVGFEVRVFESGYPIVAMLDNWPDVFLIDIELPDINGLEICKWLKGHEASSHIPVILLSSDAYLRVLAAAAHADDYVEKDVAHGEITARVVGCLSASQLTDGNSSRY